MYLTLDRPSERTQTSRQLASLANEDAVSGPARAPRSDYKCLGQAREVEDLHVDWTRRPVIAERSHEIQGVRQRLQGPQTFARNLSVYWWHWRRVGPADRNAP
jgi:hypothetical protein